MARFEDRIVELLPSLRRYARGLTGERADAEDLVQDSIETALSRAPQQRGDNLRGWLLAIMTNLHRNHWRRNATASAALAQKRITEPVTSMDGFERTRLIAALDNLEPDHRAVLMLVVIEGYRYAEVADMLEIPIGTVMSRLSRARRNLAEAWQRGAVIELRRPG